MIFAHLLIGGLQQSPTWYLGLPTQLVSLPRGWAWLQRWIPPAPEVVQELQFIMIVACGLAIIGLFTRAACVIAASTALLVLGIPNFYLKINHGHHLAELCAILLAVSPAGDALSVDQLIHRLRGGAPHQPSARYGVPVRMAMLLLATTYLFPGFWKLWESGDLWLTGAKVRAEILTKLAELPDYAPQIPLVDSPVLCALLGTWTLLFEVGFVFALFHPITRIVAVFNAVAFHLGVSLSMGIAFPLYLPLIAALTFGEQRFKAPERVAGALGGRAQVVADWLSRHAETLVARMRLAMPREVIRSYSAQPPGASGAAWIMGSVLALLPETFPSVEPREMGAAWPPKSRKPPSRRGSRTTSSALALT